MKTKVKLLFVALYAGAIAAMIGWWFLIDTAVTVDGKPAFVGNTKVVLFLASWAIPWFSMGRLSWKIIHRWSSVRGHGKTLHGV